MGTMPKSGRELWRMFLSWAGLRGREDPGIVAVNLNAC